MTHTLDLSRSYSYFNPDTAPAVDIIGAGATGSRVFEQLISLGVTDIRVYDSDTVDSHNIGNQLYLQADIGKLKVEGLRSFTRNKLGGIPPNTHFIAYNYAHGTGRSTPQHEHCPRISLGTLTTLATIKQRVVFLLVDSMEQRRICFKAIKECRYLYAHMIETRMGPTHGFCYTISPLDESQRTRWGDTLIDDSEAQNAGACGNQITVASTAQLLSSIAVSEYVNIANGAHNPFYQGIYTSPFFYEIED